MTKLIPLTRGLYSLVDNSDYTLVGAKRWYAQLEQDGRCVAVSCAKTSPGRVLLHRYLMGDSDLLVDHINGDSLDNRRSNLRWVTNAENMQNRRGASRRSITGVRNVYPHRASGGFQVQVRVKGRVVHCGTYQTVDEADRIARAARARFMTHAPESAEQRRNAAGQTTAETKRLSALAVDVWGRDGDD